MIKFNEGACHVLAEDTRASFADVDKALSSHARMMGTMVETFEGAGLQAVRTQRHYARVVAALNQILQGRNEMVELVAELQATQRKSNVAEVSFGCAAPWADTILKPTGIANDAAHEPAAA